MGTAIYRRVSTHRQERDGVSLDTQLEKLEAYCLFKDLTNTKQYTDVGTGRDTNRIEFTKMMDDVKKGKIKNIVIYRLDRLTRSVADLDNLLKTLNEYNCGLHSATESLDTSTANGRMMVNLIGVLAQWESETISERVSVNMDSLASQGIWMSAVPYGFYLGCDKRLKVKEDEANILREAYNLVLKGESFSSAERRMNDKYGLNWGHDFLVKKIRAASTVGDIYRNGSVYQKTHEPIIDKATQKILLDKLKVNQIPRRLEKADDLFRQKVKCYRCSSYMSLSVSASKYNTFVFRYICDKCYRTDRKSISVSERIIEQSFIDYFKTLELTEFKQKAKVDRNALVNELKAIDDKLDRIQRAWINDMMSDDDLIKYRNELQTEKENIELRMKDAEIELPQENIKEAKEYFNNLYAHLTREEKRMFVQRFVKAIHFKRELIEGYQKKYDVKVTAIDFY